MQTSPSGSSEQRSDVLEEEAGSAQQQMRLTPTTTADLRRQLEASATAGDAEAQFKLGVLYCFGQRSVASVVGEDKDSEPGAGCEHHGHRDQPEDSPVIDPASLDFLIGPGACVGWRHMCLLVYSVMIYTVVATGSVVRD